MTFSPGMKSSFKTVKSGWPPAAGPAAGLAAGAVAAGAAGTPALALAAKDGAGWDAGVGAAGAPVSDDSTGPPRDFALNVITLPGSKRISGGSAAISMTAMEAAAPKI